MGFNFISSSVSHIGHVRPHNEDAFLEKQESGLWVVADGMGGHEAGDFASQLIIDTLDKLEKSHHSESFTEDIKSALYSVNTHLIQLGEKHDRINGSTAVVMLINGHQCDYLWAGDSRLYRLRENELVQLTRDHSQAEIYVELGMITREEASQHVSANLLTRCIGTDDDLQLESGSCDIQVGDRYLLSSDGLDKHVAHKDIERTLIDHGRDEALNQLIGMTLDNGGTDNVTITIVDIMD